MSSKPFLDRHTAIGSAKGTYRQCFLVIGEQLEKRKQLTQRRRSASTRLEIVRKRDRLRFPEAPDSAIPHIILRVWTFSRRIGS